MRKKSKLKEIKKDLRASGVRPSRQRGQNFLIDDNILSEIVSFAKPSFEESIIEIGPGLGALTEKLKSAENLSLIEIEPEFCRQLKIKYPHAKIINRDAREVNFSKLGSDLLVFGNLPYVYSTDIIFTLLDNRRYIKRAVLLLQKEFSERMAASPGGRDYGVLSVSLQLWAEVKLGAVVGGDSFHPATKVSSRIVQLDFLKESRYPVRDFAALKKLVKASFMQRRKKLANSLKGSGFYTAKQVSEALDLSAIDGARRAETLSILEFINLAEAITK